MTGRAGQDDGPVVETAHGKVRGSSDGEVHRFEGIPYAAPVGGAHRWRSPRPVVPWAGIRDASRPGDACPQPAVRPTAQSEDCLNLMVTTSATPSADPRPVMVFLDAGGLVVSSNTGIDHRRLVSRGDVVVVQPNERVGVMGFFAHPDLDDPAAGAFGIRDQQAALRWVQENIAAFGGDPGNVTLFGISGGGVCTCAHLAAPASAGLFHRAIVQSGPARTDLPTYLPEPPTQVLVRSLERARAAGSALASALGVDGADALERLRRVPAEALVAHATAFASIAHGNEVLPHAPIDALDAGDFHRVPVMIGATRDEATFWVNLAFPAGTEEPDARHLLAPAVVGRAGAWEEYAAGVHADALTAAVAAAHTDRFIALRTWQTQQALARHVPVYAYSFDDRTAPLDPGYSLPSQESVAASFLAYHGSDFQYLIDTESHRAPFDDEQRVLADQVVTAWGAFAHGGVPASTSMPAWPRFDPAASEPHVQQLTTASQGGIGPAGDLVARHRLDFWSSVA